jgi:membrane dipeptidase
MFIFDAHLDLAMNAMEWNRDFTRPLEEIRQREAALVEGTGAARMLADKPDRARGTVSLPELRRAGIGLCVATQIARYVKPKNDRSGWNSPAQAWAQTQGQLAWYQAMEDAGEMKQINDLAGLDAHLADWMKAGPAETGTKTIGYILSLEGADSMITPQHLERAFAYGLRAVGPAHYGPGTYAQGTNATGGLGPRGKELLAEMERLGIILDATHLCDDSFWEALDHFHGPVWASHNNVRALVPHNRQFSDEQIKELIKRGAVIGSVFDAWMMVTGWERGKTTPESAGLKLERIIDHIDHICQLAGNSHHCGIGSDLDGGFGNEQTPADLKSIYDLTNLPGLLAKRGYQETDIVGIMHGNFLNFVRKAWSR